MVRPSADMKRVVRRERELEARIRATKKELGEITIALKVLASLPDEDE